MVWIITDSPVTNPDNVSNLNILLQEYEESEHSGQHYPFVNNTDTSPFLPNSTYYVSVRDIMTIDGVDRYYSQWSESKSFTTTDLHDTVFSSVTSLSQLTSTDAPFEYIGYITSNDDPENSYAGQLIFVQYRYSDSGVWETFDTALVDSNNNVKYNIAYHDAYMTLLPAADEIRPVRQFRYSFPGDALHKPAVSDHFTMEIVPSLSMRIRVDGGDWIDITSTTTINVVEQSEIQFDFTFQPSLNSQHQINIIDYNTNNTYVPVNGGVMTTLFRSGGLIKDQELVIYDAVLGDLMQLYLKVLAPVIDLTASTLITEYQSHIVSLNVIEKEINKPVITSILPSDYITPFDSNPITVVALPFTSSVSGMVHTSSIWYIYDSSGAFEPANLIYSLTNVENSCNINQGGYLNANTGYFIKVKYIGEKDGVTYESSVSEHTSLIIGEGLSVSTPYLTSPIDNFPYGTQAVFLISSVEVIGGTPIQEETEVIFSRDEAGNDITYQYTATDPGYITGNLTHLYYDLTGQPEGQQLYIRFRVTDLNLGWSSWSAVFPFTVGYIERPEKPIITIPVNNAVNINPNLFNLEVSSYTGPSTYESTYYEVSSTSDFNSGNIVAYSTFIGDTTNLILVLSHNTEYYIRVRHNGSGLSAPSYWSDTVSFTTESNITTISPEV